MKYYKNVPIEKEWCIRVIGNPIKFEILENKRVRFWGKIREFDNKVLKVVTLKDKLIIHNVFSR